MKSAPVYDGRKQVEPRAMARPDDFIGVFACVESSGRAFCFFAN